MELSAVSRNPNFTIEFIIAHPKFNWDCWKISKNKNITMDFIKAHPEYKWNWWGLSANP